jgi:hypothetical protein
LLKATSTPSRQRAASAGQWIGDCLTHSLACFEAVYLAHMLSAWRENDTTQLEELDAEFIASRETAELRAETLQMGHSLAKLLRDLSLSNRRPGESRGPVVASAQSLDTGTCALQGIRRYDDSPEQALTGFPQPSFPLAWSCTSPALYPPDREPAWRVSS